MSAKPPFVDNAFTRMSRLERLLLAAAIVDEESKRENPDRSLGLLNLAHFTITRSIQLGAARGEL
jgi:hypothetical protein